MVHLNSSGVRETLTGALDLGSNIFTNSFEMYRALLRESFLSTHFDTTGGNEVVSGTGSTNGGAENTILAQTGTTHASTAGRRATIRTITAGGTNWAAINWGKKFFLAFSIVWVGTTSTNLTIRVQISQATTITDLAAHGLGLQTNGANINLATYGTGGSQQLVSAATNLATSARIWVLIEHDPASGDRLYINNVLKATQSTAANIPSTEPSAVYYIHGSIARTGGADVDNELIRVEHVAYGQEA